MDDVRFGNVSFNSQMQSPLLSPPLTLSYPVHNWPDCPARLTDHPGSLAYLRRTGAVRRSPGRTRILTFSTM